MTGRARFPALAALVFALGVAEEAQASGDVGGDATGAGAVDAPPPHDRRSPLAIGASVFPGVVAHGSGHLVAGKTSTGLRLLALEGAGLLLLGGGLVGLATTGASRRTVGPFALVTVSGAALFLGSALADIYGVSAPEGGTGVPLRRLPWIETYAGIFGVHDPTFRHGPFAVYGADLRHGALRVSPSAWMGTGEVNRRLRVEAAWRLSGPTADDAPWSRGARGSSLDVEVALMDHDFRRERFARTTGEVWVAGRLAMEKVAPSLRGSFADGAAGLAIASVRHTRATDTDTLLLARIGYGFYLGGASRSRGEVAAFYEHRRDGLVGGTKLPGIGAGFLGSFGARARAFLDDRWGIALEGQVGSALVGGVAVVFREGARP